jgi:RNA polymerase sigma factor (sigma-70 family)
VEPRSSSPHRPATPAESAPRDTALHAGLLRGDERALAAAYDHAAGAVLGAALRVTRSRQAAEDITQQVFLDLWRRPDRFDPGRGALRSWLATIAHRRAIDHVRREEARRAREEREQREGRARTVAVPSVEDVAEGILVAERVRLALATLPESRRAPIELAYFGGLTYQQVARRLGVPEGTTKTRIRAGLRDLAAALGADGGAEAGSPAGVLAGVAG